MDFNQFIENPNTEEGKYGNRLYNKFGQDVLLVLKHQFEGDNIYTVYESDEEDKEPTLKNGFFKDKRAIGYLIQPVVLEV